MHLWLCAHSQQRCPHRGSRTAPPACPCTRVSTLSTVQARTQHGVARASKLTTAAWCPRDQTSPPPTQLVAGGLRTLPHEATRRLFTSHSHVHNDTTEAISFAVPACDGSGWSKLVPCMRVLLVLFITPPPRVCMHGYHHGLDLCTWCPAPEMPGRPVLAICMDARALAPQEVTTLGVHRAPVRGCVRQTSPAAPCSRHAAGQHIP